MAEGTATVERGLAPAATCAGCGASSRRELILTSRDRLVGGPGLFRVVRCPACRLALTEPRLDQDSLSGYYPQSYPSFQAGGVQSGPTRRARVGDLLNALRLWHTVSLGPYREIARMRPGRLLDVGCGGGVLGERFRRRGWKVYGVDPSPHACAGASQRGLEVHCGELHDAPWAPASFDAVVFNHSLEHLDDPAEALRRARSLLREGGLLAVSVPNFGCWQRLAFGGRWFQLDVPRHLQHFDRSTLTRVVGDAGFTVRAARTHSMLAGLTGSVQYALFGRWVLPRPAAVAIGLASTPLLAALDAARQGDCLSVVASR